MLLAEVANEGALVAGERGELATLLFLLHLSRLGAIIEAGRTVRYDSGDGGVARDARDLVHRGR